MYAHINTWQLNEKGDANNNTSAQGLAARLREQPGFAAYSLVRTGDREVTAITVFRSREQLEAALQAVADFVQSDIRRYTAGDPQRKEGDVLEHEVGVVLPGDV
jgi:heme-degrading monooxygenase HmoA